jgi:hypothetical protein
LDAADRHLILERRKRRIKFTKFSENTNFFVDATKVFVYFGFQVENEECKMEANGYGKTQDA